MKLTLENQTTYLLAGSVAISFGLWAVYFLVYAIGYAQQFERGPFLFTFVIGNVGGIAWVVSNRPKRQKKTEKP
jgi:hypothetical protein